jgi:hypothetical protein
MSAKYSKGTKKYVNFFPILGDQNFSQIGIFGLKTNNLATLVGRPVETASMKGFFLFPHFLVFLRRGKKFKNFVIYHLPHLPPREVFGAMFFCEGFFGPKP